MYVAKNSRGVLVNLLQIEKSQPLIKETYYCPACRQKLILKAGNVKQRHFAHCAKKTCESFSEGETAEHLAGKALLFNWDQEAQLEVSLASIGQRADVLLPQLALEFQCSPLSTAKLEKRVAGYKKMNLQQWWLTGERLKEGVLRQGSSHFCLFNQTFGVHFWHLNTSKKSIELYTHLLTMSKQKSFKRKIFNFQEQPLSQIFGDRNSVPSIVCSTKKDWQQQKLSVQKKLYYCLPEILQIQQALYRRGSHLLQLPEILFAPSIATPFFGDWLYFLRFHFFQKSLSCSAIDLHEFSFQLTQRFLQTYQLQQKFPLVEPAAISAAFFTESCRLFQAFQQKKTSFKVFSADSL
ncbi:competence protein CoiA [Enterococcus sp. HY326]|uniref:competence protein CoiA n=1 Tax=Enterococcus sp. HY326 TaxID=2971265 RepID=UPI002240A49F|nr:competence protein CoiA family protein [Enterococcus sp. HY326]